MGEPKDDDIVTTDSLTIALRTGFRPEIASVSLDFQIQVGSAGGAGRMVLLAALFLDRDPHAPGISNLAPTRTPAVRYLRPS
jgi:hypothetical protein